MAASSVEELLQGREAATRGNSKWENLIRSGSGLFRIQMSLAVQILVDSPIVGLGLSSDCVRRALVLLFHEEEAAVEFVNQIGDHAQAQLEEQWDKKAKL